MSNDEKLDTRKLLEIIVELVIEKKGEDIAVIDLNGVTSVTDYFVLVTGNSNVHIKAIADDINHKLKKDHGTLPWHVEGMEAQKWILLDYVDVVVHVFDGETRKYYGLEKLWEDAEITHIDEESSSLAG